MSRRALLAAWLIAAPLQAQNLEDRSVTELQALTARLDSQLTVIAAARARRDLASVPQRAALLYESGDVALVLWSAVPAATARRLVTRADSLLRSSGVVPPSFTRSLVFVMNETADSAAVLATPELSGRKPTTIYVPTSQGFARPPDDWWVLGPLFAAYTASLDSAWSNWGQNAWGFVRWPRDRAAEWGGRELTAPGFRAGDECLSGRPSGCRRFLGLDADAHPYAARFSPSEIRALLANYYGGYPGIVPCRLGDDAACLNVIERYDFSGTGAIPAGGDTRAGLLAAVAAMHGPRAVQSALADRQGSVGDRLARAAGISVDSLVLEWRAWALSGGRPRHVQAGLGDLVPAIAAVALLLFLASRSGRWT